MTRMSDDHVIRDVEALQALYAKPVEAAVIKEIDHIAPHYRALIEAAPFVLLATCGPDGLDCSPRGDAPGFVRVTNPKTLLIPDRRGNNRLDSLKNLLADSRIALLFLIPGVGETLRVNGRAVISVDPDLLASFTAQGKSPRCVVVVTVDHVYFQCSKAVVRARLWDAAAKVDRKELPTAGEILAALSGGKISGETYDREQPERLKTTLY
jgi:PPOX class probable FMN-dependent enzyme